MTEHLDDRQITAAVAGLELEPAAEEHLAGCLDCRRRVASLDALIDRRRVALAAGEPNPRAVRDGVVARLAAGEVAAAAPRRRGWLWPVAAAAAAVLVAAAAWLLAPDAPRPSVGRGDLAVEEILAEVDALLDDDSIPGFEVIDPGLDALESYAQSGSS